MRAPVPCHGLERLLLFSAWLLHTFPDSEADDCTVCCSCCCVIRALNRSDIYVKLEEETECLACYLWGRVIPALSDFFFVLFSSGTVAHARRCIDSSLPPQPKFVGKRVECYRYSYVHVAKGAMSVVFTRRKALKARMARAQPHRRAEADHRSMNGLRVACTIPVKFTERFRFPFTIIHFSAAAPHFGWISVDSMSCLKFAVRLLCLGYVQSW